MPETPSPVTIPNDLLQAIYREARKSYPNEACGWLTGSAAGNQADAIRACVNAKTLGIHSAVVERGPETAYEFTAQDAIDLDRSFDTDAPAVVIYHSHPNGRAYFSKTDRRFAKSMWGDGPAYPVQQLVVGIDASRVVEAALFAWSWEANDFVEVSRLQGDAV